MRFSARFPSAVVALLVLLAGPAWALSPPPPPSVEFGELYRDVELASIFHDQKTFADAIPRGPPAEIVAAYAREKDQPGFDLTDFVGRHVTPPLRPSVMFQREAGLSAPAYIDEMWEVLQRKPDEEADSYSSLLPLPKPYIVAGGRFSEIYYWDSYFTMLGLEQDGRTQLARDMLENIASLIARYGHMPNGNRTYYLSRSQPPFFSLMVDLVAAHDGEGVLLAHLPELQAEYDFWMDGAADLKPGSAFRRVVRLPDGAVLNRYWDDRAEPRDESYRQDVETAKRANRPEAEVWRDLRAGAESGWDFSSRWLADGRTLETIRTTEIAPVDLNSLMTHLEQTLAKAYAVKGDTAAAERYSAAAAARVEAIRRLMWNDRQGFFADLLWRDGAQTGVLSAATVYPLAFGVAAPDEARVVARTIRDKLLAPGGLRTTLTETGQQWDQPNGWAPLQYLAIQGLRAYGEPDLAREIAARWIGANLRGYAATGVLVEKYDVEAPPDARAVGGGGGEYALQVGFGWTNGVLAKLMADYPDIADRAAAAAPR